MTFGLIPPPKPDVEEISEEDIDNILKNVSLVVEQSFDIEKIGGEVASIVEENLANPLNTGPLSTLPTYPVPSNNPVNPYK